MFSVVVVSLRRSGKCGGCMSRRGEAFVRPGSHPPVIDRQPRAALSWSSGARHGARGLSGRIRTLTFYVVVASCGDRGGETVVRPGSHPPAIGRQPRAALSVTSGARHGARGLSGRIGPLTFSVVVASFLLREGFSRRRSMFLIIFKLWYKRTPNGETEARTPSATAPNLPGLGIETGSSIPIPAPGQYRLSRCLE